MANCEYCGIEQRESFWKNRHRFGKCLFTFLALIVVLLIILLALKITQTKPTNSDICENCNNSSLLQRVNFSVDPCENFYEFSCTNDIKSQEDLESSLNFLNDLLKQQMLSVLEKPVQENDTRYLILMKSFYKACITNTEDENFVYLQTLMKELGGWPVIEGNRWRGRFFSWISIVYKFMGRGLFFNIFFKLHVGQVNSHNIPQRILHLKPASVEPFYNSLKHGFNSTSTWDYLDYLIEITVAFGADRERANREMKNMLDLEIELSKILTEAGVNEEVIMNIQTLQNKFSFVPWLQYINTMLEPILKISLKDPVVIKAPVYFEKLGKILTKTPKRVLANYVFWKGIIHNHLEHLHLKAKIPMFWNQIEVKKPEKCLEQTSDRLDVAATAFYIKSFFISSHLKIAVDIYENIKTEFEEILSKTNWLDQRTKENWLEQADRFIFQIEEFSNEENINDYYLDLKFDSSCYLQNVLILNTFLHQKIFSTLGKTRQNYDWKITNGKTLLDGRKLSLLNFLPDAILHLHFLDIESSAVFEKYATIGALFANQLSAPNPEDIDDWECGAENIANINWITDLIAYKSTYRAFKKLRQIVTEEILPLTQEQMLWIMLTKKLCDSQLINASITNDNRLNKALMDSYEFIADFHCPVGSTMNPTTKCEMLNF